MSEMDSAERLMNVLESEYAGQIAGSAEYVAMRALAGEITGALGGSWMNAADRARVWLAANSLPEEAPQSAPRLRLPSTRTILTGGVAVALSAAAGYVLLHHRRKVVAAA
jgi:hypothetical protein